MPTLNRSVRIGSIPASGGIPGGTVTHGDQLTVNHVGPWTVQGVSKGSETLDNTLSAPGRGFWRLDTPSEFASASAWPSNANDSNPSILNATTLLGGIVTGSPVTIDGYSIPVGTQIVQFRDFSTVAYDFYASTTSDKFLFRGCKFRYASGVGSSSLFNDSTSGSGQQIMMHYCDIGLASADPPDGIEGIMHIKFLSGANHRLLRGYHTLSPTYIQPNAPGCEIIEYYIDDYLYTYGEGGHAGTIPNPDAGHLNGISSEGLLTSLKIQRCHIVAPSPDKATGSTGSGLGSIGYGTQSGQVGYGSGSALGRKVPATDCIALFTNAGDNNGTTPGSILVDSNYIGGTSYALYAGGGSGSTGSNIWVINNKFTTKWWTDSGSVGAVASPPVWNTNGNAQSGNVWADDYGTGGDGTTLLADRQYPAGNGPRAGTAVI